jgi:hypothetical protein
MEPVTAVCGSSSPLRLLRDESCDANGTLSPISSRSNGTDTETDAKKKVKKENYILNIYINI